MKNCIKLISLFLCCLLCLNHVYAYLESFNVVFSYNNKDYFSEFDFNVKEGETIYYNISSFENNKNEELSFTPTSSNTRLISVSKDTKDSGRIFIKKNGTVQVSIINDQYKLTNVYSFTVGHCFDESKNEILKKETCYEEGKVKKYCTYCKDYYIENIKLLNHQYLFYLADESHDSSYKKCQICLNEEKMKTLEYFNILFYDSLNALYTNTALSSLKEGDSVAFKEDTFIPEDVDSQEIIASSSNEKVINISHNIIHAVGVGEATITLTSKYSPSVYKQFNIHVEHASYVFHKPDSSHSKPYKTCSYCHCEKDMITLSSFSTFFNVHDGIGEYENIVPKELDEKEEIYYAFSSYYPNNYDNKDIEVISSNSSIIKVNPTLKTLKALKAGTATITIRVAYNPKIKQTFNITVNHHFSAYKTTTKATVFKSGVSTSTCSLCNAKKTKTLSKLKPKLTLSYKSKSIKKKKYFTLSIKDIAYGDSVSKIKANNSRVTIKKMKTNQYKITGKKKGTVTITVTLKSKKKSTCKVKVK